MNDIKYVKIYLVKALDFFLMFCRHMLYRLHGLFQDTVTIRTKQGLLTMFTKDEGIGEPLYREGQYEYSFSLEAVRFLKKTGFIPSDHVTMIDVGANLGLISIGLILSGEVDGAIALEPEPANFELLRRNVSQNGLKDKIVCLQIAAGIESKIMNMEISPANPGDHRIRIMQNPEGTERYDESKRSIIQVKSLPLPAILNLPEVLNSRIDPTAFMWIDTQGYEGPIFMGGQTWLKKGIPTVSEVWPYGILRSGISLADYSQTVSAIWSDFWVYRRGHFTRYPITVLDRYLEELGADGYAENLIFTKTS